MKKNVFQKKHKIFPIFLPFLGCKNKCVYCNQNKITNLTISDLENFLEEKIKEIIIQKNNIDEIALYGSSFTGLAISEQEKILRLINNKISDIKLRISTYPEFINFDILKLLYDYNVRTIELGAQILDDIVLKKIGRTYNVKLVEEVCDQIKKLDFKLGLQIIIGLPYSDKTKELETIEKIKKIQTDYLRIYPLVIVKDTELAKMFESGEYMPLTLDEIIDRCSEILENLEDTNIRVIRIGLHSEAAFTENDIVWKAAYHPALGELVKSEYVYRKIKKIKNNCNFDKIKIKYFSAFRSIIFGQNKRYFEKYKNIGIEEFESAAELSKDEILICSDSEKKIAEIKIKF